MTTKNLLPETIRNVDTAPREGVPAATTDALLDQVLVRAEAAASHGAIHGKSRWAANASLSVRLALALAGYQKRLGRMATPRQSHLDVEQ